MVFDNLYIGGKIRGGGVAKNVVRGNAAQIFPILPPKVSVYI